MKKDTYTGWSYRTPDGSLVSGIYNRDGAKFYMALAFNNRTAHVTNGAKMPTDYDAAKKAGYKLARVRVTAI